MKLKHIYSILIAFMVQYVIAQDTVLIYFTKDGQRTMGEIGATYYRKAFLDKDNVWRSTDYSMTDKIRAKGTYASRNLSVRQGLFTHYFENGAKKSEGVYINNLKEGYWTYWYENGNKKSEGKMTNDKKEDTWVLWHENGVKSGEGKYVANLCEDTWKYWHESGALKSEGKYLHDVRTDAWIFWDVNGLMDAEEKYMNGKLSYKTWYHYNGKKKAHGPISEGKKTEEWTYTNIDERVFYKGSYINGSQHGTWIRYFENGESMKIIFENGIVRGKIPGSILIDEQ